MESAVPPGLTNVTAIAAGEYHFLALKGDGTVVGWYSSEGTMSGLPAGLTNVIAIAAGGWHSLALKADGTVVAWGSNNGGAGVVPAGLTASLPGLRRCAFSVNPLTPGLVTVRIPSGAVTTWSGAGNAASNLLQRTYELPNAVHSWTLYAAE